MLQQIIAIFIILFFISRLILQKKKNNIKNNEFIFWMFFWIMAGLAVINIKSIDKFSSALGFSSSGIAILSYIAIIVLFYICLKLRLKIEKMDRNITKIVREIGIQNDPKSKQK